LFAGLAAVAAVSVVYFIRLKADVIAVVYFTGALVRHGGAA